MLTTQKITNQLKTEEFKVSQFSDPWIKEGDFNEKENTIAGLERIVEYKKEKCSIFKKITLKKWAADDYLEIGLTTDEHDKMKKFFTRKNFFVLQDSLFTENIIQISNKIIFDSLINLLISLDVSINHIKDDLTSMIERYKNKEAPYFNAWIKKRGFNNTKEGSEYFNRNIIKIIKSIDISIWGDGKTRLSVYVQEDIYQRFIAFLIKQGYSQENMDETSECYHFIIDYTNFKSLKDFLSIIIKFDSSVKEIFSDIMSLFDKSFNASLCQVTFLEGSYERLAKGSSIKEHFFNNPIMDKQLVPLIFSYLYAKKEPIYKENEPLIHHGVKKVK